MGMNLYRMSMEGPLRKLLVDMNLFHNFESLAYWQNQFNNVVAVTVFFACLKVIVHMIYLRLLFIYYYS